MKEKNKQKYYVVTEEEYQEGLASGLTDDEVMKPGKYKILPNHFKPKPGATEPRNCKVKITTYLDADVLEYFKKRSEQPNAAPYQTQINNELRRVMEAGTNGNASVETDLLNNKKFLKALKKELEAV